MEKKIPILFREELSEISIDELIPILVCRTLILNLLFWGPVSGRALLRASQFSASCHQGE